MARPAVLLAEPVAREVGIPVLIEAKDEMADDAQLPDDIDPKLWFASRRRQCRGERDYLFDKHWLTHPGRMAAYCPHDAEHPDYRISLSELPESLPDETRYWVRGFLAGNLPTAPVVNDLDAPELHDWQAAAEEFARTGEWTLPVGDEDEDEDDEDDEDDVWELQADGAYVRRGKVDGG